MPTLASYLNPTPNTIWLAGTREHYEEARASATVKPGYGVEVESAGTVHPYPTSGGDTSVLIAVEDALQGLTINDAYSTGDLVRYVQLEPGDKVQVRVPAGAAAIALGDPLKANGDGTFIKQGGSGTILLYAEQALDNSGGGSEAFVGARKK